MPPGEIYAQLTNASHLTFDGKFNTFVSSSDGSAGWMTDYPWYGEDARTSTQNDEAEYYSDPSVGTNPFADVNGVLNVTATVAKPGSNPYNLPYTSGIITSYKSLNQTYGYFEMRAELPAGQGLWPAFWLDPTALPTTSELDVFEVIGNAPTQLFATTHTYPVGGVSSEDSQELTVANTSTSFNTFGVDWEPKTVTFYMNGQVIATAPTPNTMNAPMYMLANLAVGGAGSWPGVPGSASEFPASYKIDYVRAYATPATTEVGGTQAILTSGITGQLLLSGKGWVGATVELENAGGVVIQTAETSSTGSFSFTGLFAGDYQVDFLSPAGHTLVAGGPANAATGLTSLLTLSDGQTLTLASESLVPPAARPITVTPATEAVTTTDAASVKPFTSVAITDTNAGQTETASVTLSAAANGTLSDPNAATDGSTIASGVLTVSGSATAVATALDGLVFTPTPNQVAAGTVVTTTATATIKDTAGETSSAASTVTATQVAATPPSADTLALQISEDAWKGDAEFTVSVDGKQVGGDYTASAVHSSGDAGTFLLTGDWGPGVNDVAVSFINDAYGGTSETDRNLYINSISENSITYTGTSAALLSDGKDSFAVGGTTATATPPADTLTLNLSEDFWRENAEFVLYIDGKAVMTPQSVTALHDQNATQSFSFTGNFGAGTHTIGIAFVNDAYGGSASEDRNLHIDGVSLNGSSVLSTATELYSKGDGQLHGHNEGVASAARGRCGRTTVASPTGDRQLPFPTSCRCRSAAAQRFASLDED